MSNTASNLVKDRQCLTAIKHQIMTKLTEGNLAPDFSGKNQFGKEISLADFKGKRLVLYFYPKDNTPGCTAEACNLNDNYEAFLAKGYEVVGVSPDSQKSHQNFAKKYGLRFNLISDPEKSILENYGVWGEKKMYGKSYMGVLRTTFIINEKGIIEKIIEQVDTKNHTDQILG
jgi:peroxiredoxin Q/BCP